MKFLYWLANFFVSAFEGINHARYLYMESFRELFGKDSTFRMRLSAALDLFLFTIFILALIATIIYAVKNWNNF